MDGLGYNVNDQVFVQSHNRQVVIKIGQKDRSYSGNRFSSQLTNEEALTLAMQIIESVKDKI